MRDSSRRPLRAAMAISLAVCTSGSAQTPADSGFEFNRFANKNPESLAQKPGGPTERLEVQTTDDHIDYVVKAYELKSANAAEIYQFVLNAVTLEGGFVDRLAAGSAVEFDERDAHCSFEGTSILVVTAPEWMLPYLDQTIAVLDRPGVEKSAFGTGYTFLRPRHRRPSELVDLISASAASGVEILVADDSRNVMYIEDTPSFVGVIMEAMDAFDRPPDQIEAHVRIYELDDADAHDLGLDWYAWKKAIAGGDLSFVWGTPGTTSLNIESLTASLTLTPQVAVEFLNYQADKGHARVLTDARVRVINGETAVVESVKQIPYVIRGFADGGVADSFLRDSPQATDPDGVIKEFTEGVTVELTPTIGTDSMLLAVTASVASHVGYTPNQSVPVIQSSSVNSVIDISSGIPAVLGGLTRHTLVNERTGIPGLMEIPGLRYLFSRDVEREHVSHVILTIVPTTYTHEDRGEVPDPAAWPAQVPIRH